jgi:hypothetical protein
MWPGLFCHRPSCIAERGVTVLLTVRSMVEKKLKAIITQMQDKIIFSETVFVSSFLAWLSRC